MVASLGGWRSWDASGEGFKIFLTKVVEMLVTHRGVTGHDVIVTNPGATTMTYSGTSGDVEPLGRSSGGISGGLENVGCIRRRVQDLLQLLVAWGPTTMTCGGTLGEVEALGWTCGGISGGLEELGCIR